ncbi:MAG: hypothetical protein A2Y93_14270 [Chloroflexi bacterium RBG_13_68_17]|nr:MAG: hypothetical protein A2Y93_14270 [Chloroflexi bacterium RBG_13_68_17]
MGLIAAVVATLTAGLSMVLSDTRVRLSVLGLQYVCVGFLVSAALPPAVAGAKVIAGLAAVTILGTALFLPGGHGPGRAAPRPERLHPLHGVAVGLVGAAALALGSRPWMGLPGMTDGASLAAATLMALGLLQVGVSQGALRVGVGLMTVLSGFEVAYSFIEPSLAVTALLGAVHLGIALVISYLLRVVPLVEEQSPEAQE